MSAETQSKAGFPKFMLAAALVLWGWATDRWWLAGLCGLLLEAPHWLSWRWDFKEKSSIVAWRLCVFLLVMAMTMIFLDGARAQAMPLVFSWLPLILLPLQFIDSFGTSQGIPVTAFSMVSRRNRDRAKRHGLSYRESRLNFGYVYLFSTLIAAALGPLARDVFFLSGFLAMCSWALMTQVRGTWKSLGFASYLLAVLACAGAYAGQQGLIQLYRSIIWVRGGFGMEPPSDRMRQTGMGDISELQQSTDIKWRLQAMQGPLPRLLRSCTYQTFYDDTWRNSSLPPFSNNFEADYNNLNEVDQGENNTYYVAAKTGSLQENTSAGLKRFHLRGSMPEKASLPVPSNAASLFGFDFQNLEINSWGTIRFDPSFPVADGVVLWDESRYTERPPWYKYGTNSPDLAVPTKERAALDAEIEKIGLKQGTVPERLKKLRDYFAKNFTYTREKDVEKWRQKWKQEQDSRLKKNSQEIPKEQPSLITTFLSQVRRGHCEFFATAGTLMLREAGIPARYSIGYAVKDFDPLTGEAIIRGTHAHAWSRVWDDASQHWVDADFTPSDWLQKDSQQVNPNIQAWKDRLLRWKEDFLIWRNQPGHMALITGIFLLPVFLGLAYIGRILWRSRRKNEPTSNYRTLAEPITTPLHELADAATKVLGPRPSGQPLVAWLTLLTGQLRQPEQLNEALALHQRLRFDPEAHKAREEMLRLQELASTITMELKSLQTA